jgi:hypothetical protein
LVDSIGTLLIDDWCASNMPIHAFDWDLSTTGSLKIRIEKDFDGCSPALILPSHTCHLAENAVIQIGALRVTLSDVQIIGGELESLQGSLP